MMTWRCFKECQRIEELLPAEHRKPVKQERGAKQVYVDEQLVGFSEYGRWSWTEDGKKYLTSRGAVVQAVTAIIERNW